MRDRPGIIKKHSQQNKKQNYRFGNIEIILEIRQQNVKGGASSWSLC